jgi:hypothetical protein
LRLLEITSLFTIESQPSSSSSNPVQLLRIAVSEFLKSGLFSEGFPEKLALFPFSKLNGVMTSSSSSKKKTEDNTKVFGKEFFDSISMAYSEYLTTDLMNINDISSTLFKFSNQTHDISFGYGLSLLFQLYSSKSSVSVTETQTEHGKEKEFEKEMKRHRIRLLHISICMIITIDNLVRKNLSSSSSKRIETIGTYIQLQILNALKEALDSIGTSMSNDETIQSYVNILASINRTSTAKIIEEGFNTITTTHY